MSNLQIYFWEISKNLMKNAVDTFFMVKWPPHP